MNAIKWPIKTHTNVQILNGPNGAPAFVVIPYADYIREQKSKGDYIPHEVVTLMVDNDWSPVRAWREYLGFTQTDVAKRLGVSQSAYAQQESSHKLRKTSREKIAAVLGIDAALLDL